MQETIKDVGLWKIIINGYPYQSIEALGVANKEEAFTATKQAVYCYIHGNKLQDYEAIGEAGHRTLNAMHKIVSNAQNSNETKITNHIQINKEEEGWEVDKKEPQYISMIFGIVAKANMKNYKIKIQKEDEQDIGGIKLTDLQNNEKNEFAPHEKFKVLVPIKNMKEKGNIKLTVESEVETKPILYGKAPNNRKQDYALTAISYEEGTGETSIQYPTNETKIIILKEDTQTKERIEGVEFALLDENKNTVYVDLRTDKEGKIEINNLIPGKYYLKETRAKEGYEAYEELIELEIAWQEQYTIKVKNNKAEKPEIEIKKQKKEKEVRAIKKLPVTGM